MRATDDTHNSEPTARPVLAGSKALRYADRALGFAVPAYWGAVGAYRSLRDHPASVRDRASLALMGGLGGAVLSWMASVIVGAMWEREAVFASTEDITYTLHAQPRVKNTLAGTASKIVSPIAHAAFLSGQPTELTAHLEVSFRDGASETSEGVRANCRYPVFVDGGARFSEVRDDPPIVTLDSLGRPVSLTYAGERVPLGSRVAHTIEERCDEILATRLPYGSAENH